MQCRPGEGQGAGRVSFTVGGGGGDDFDSGQLEEEETNNLSNAMFLLESIHPKLPTVSRFLPPRMTDTDTELRSLLPVQQRHSSTSHTATASCIACSLAVSPLKETGLL